MVRERLDLSGVADWPSYSRLDHSVADGVSHQTSHVMELKSREAEQGRNGHALCYGCDAGDIAI